MLHGILIIPKTYKIDLENGIIVSKIMYTFVIQQQQQQYDMNIINVMH